MMRMEVVKMGLPRTEEEWKEFEKGRTVAKCPNTECRRRQFVRSDYLCVVPSCRAPLPITASVNLAPRVAAPELSWQVTLGFPPETTDPF